MASRIDKQLVTAAIAQFAATGYEGSTTKEIAERAAVTEGSLFRLFKSKDALFEAAVREVVAIACGNLETIELVLKSGDDFPRGLRLAIRRFFDCMTPDFVRLRTYTTLECPELIPLFDRCFAGFLHAIETAIEANEGLFREDLEATNAARQLLGYTFHARLFAPARSQRSACESFVEMWLRGSAKPGSNKPDPQ